MIEVPVCHGSDCGTPALAQCVLFDISIPSLAARPRPLDTRVRRNTAVES
jgi:hypothetical protein